MKYTYYSFLFALLCFQSCTVKSNKKDASSEIIKATLIEEDDNIIGCGVFKIIIAMKFHNNYTNENFIGIITCPDMYEPSFFIRNQIYAVTLEKSHSTEDSSLIINPFKNENLKTYYIQDIKKVL